MKEINVAELDALLPQTQCTKCGYDDCLAYAKAMSEGEQHNQCPPGGEAGIAVLSAFLEREVLPLNPENGLEKPRVRAVIREAECIGCTKCIQACPTDAILGAGKKMHTVIAAECTGCELCVMPCPVDCIDLVAVPDAEQVIEPELRAHFRQRHQARLTRLERLKHEEKKRYQLNKRAAIAARRQDSLSDKRHYIEAALARVKAKKA